MKLPKSLGACADLLYTTRQARLKLQQQVTKLEELESAVKNHFINTLPKSQASGVAGKLGRVQLEKKPVPQIEDWDKFYSHVRKTGNFELLQRRLNETAVRERWDAEEKVPGVGVFHAIKISCTGVKK